MINHLVDVRQGGEPAWGVVGAVDEIGVLALALDRGSAGTDGVRASKVQLEDVDGGLHLGRLAFVGMQAYYVAGHSLET